MTAEREMRPQPIILEIPAHNPSSANPKAVSKVTAKEVRDANITASPQPQENTNHHHSHHSQHQHSTPPHTQQQQQQQQQQQHKTPSSHPKRDSIKTKSPTPKAVLDHVGPYLLGRTLGKGSS
ncbi:hypothetical protein BGZ80_000317, partial [Entomortierella chlamydospora]